MVALNRRQSVENTAESDEWEAAKEKAKEDRAYRPSQWLTGENVFSTVNDSRVRPAAYVECETPAQTIRVSVDDPSDEALASLVELSKWFSVRDRA